MKFLHVIAFLLVVIGGLNWGLIGLFGFNLVDYLLGWWMLLEQIIYVLVGISAIYLLIKHKDDCKMCFMDMKTMKKKK